MNILKKLILFVIFIVLSITSIAQKVAPQKEHKNAIKTNITSLFVNNYSIQYERFLNSRISVSGSFRYMPLSKLPFKNMITETLGVDEAKSQDFLKAARIGNIAITPEIKYFLSNRHEGLYLSAFYRYAKFNTGDLQVEYTEKKKAEKQSVSLSGDLISHSAGLQLGWQKNIGKRFVTDIWILGPQYGVAHGSVSGKTSKVLDADEQQLLLQNLEEYKIHYYNEKITVYEQGAQIDLKGPWAGFRTGVSVGFRF